MPSSPRPCRTPAPRCTRSRCARGPWSTPEVRICYWGTYDRDYPRNRILQEGLRASGAEVRECHAPLWRDSTDKLTRARGSWLRPDRVLRAAWTYGSLAIRFLSGP